MQSVQSFRQPVFFVPGTQQVVPVIIDFAKRRPDGVFVSSISGNTLEETATRYPGAQLGECDTVVAEKESKLISEPVEITQAQFIDALEVLPPDDWQRHVYSESFKMSERLSGRITSVFVRVNDRYYEFADRDPITHEEAVEKVSRAMAAQGTGHGGA
jgi:hypothetical protein